MPRITKKDIYKEYGIDFIKAGKSNWHIVTPIGDIAPVLVKGNKKIGNVWHFSTLPGSKEYNVTLASGENVTMCGTCAGNCENGYCMVGRYVMASVQNSLANKTVLARDYMGYLNRAIRAQIKADKIKALRIHVTGDFFSKAYLQMWVDIVRDFPGVTFWTYTKETAAEKAFDCFENANIVKSNIPGADLFDSATAGYNFGHADYVIAIYNMLKDMGKSVYICRCGMDEKQHCDTCQGCAKCDYVLFLEHGTDYNPVMDPAFPAFVDAVNAQGDIYLTK